MSDSSEDVSFAVGQCYADDKKDIKTALRLADERMYDDKKLFYEKHPELKNR